MEPAGPNAYSLHLTSKFGEREQRHAELAKRASGICSGAYQLAFQSERVIVCTDACAGNETTIAMLSCEAA